MTDTRTEQERLRDIYGLEVETVGDILDGPETASQALFDPARLESAPPLLQPGLYFGLPEKEYLAQPCLSASGIKALAASSMVFWEDCDWLNPDFEREEKDHFTIGHAFDTRILEGPEAFAERFAVALDKADYPKALVTLNDMNERLEHFGSKRAAAKGVAMERIREWEPDAESWDEIIAEFERSVCDADGNRTKEVIDAATHRRIEITARMIANDEEQRAATTGGWPQVSMFWRCKKTGVPMKCRVDYLKLQAMVDMKTMVNNQRRPIDSAIFREIAERKYTIQPSVYFEGAEAVRALIGEHGAKAIRGDPEQVEWALKWAQTKRDAWLWLFVNKKPTITRLVHYPRGGTLKTISDEIVSRMKRKFRLMSETYGTDPWLDLGPMIEMADEDVPPWALEI